MNTNKTTNSTTTITPTMQLVNKTTSAVISSSGTTMTTKSTQFIFFSISDIFESGETITSYKLKFIQSGTSKDEVILYKSNASRIITSTGYKMKHKNNGVLSFREVDITDAVINSNGETMYFAIVCNTSAGVTLYTSSATPNVYRPTKIVNKVIDNDFVKNQQYLTGQTKENDQYNINIRNGMFSYQMNLVSTYAEYLPTNLSIHFNTKYYNEAYENGLPKGWKFNYFQKVSNSGSNFIYVDGQFKKHTFVLANNLTDSSTDKLYYENDGNYLLLKLNTASTNERYEINDENNNSLFFNSSGYLTKIVNKVSASKQFTTILAYDSNRLTSITDGSSLITNISYDDTNRIVTIEKPNGKFVYIRYDSDQLMTSIENTDGDITEFGYCQTGALIRAVKPDIPIITSTYLLNRITSKNKQLTLQYLSDSKVVDRFKEESIDLNANTTHIDKSYVLNYSKLRTEVECHPFTQYLSSTKSTSHLYTYNSNGELIAINETKNGAFLSSKLFERNQAGTSAVTSKQTPYMFLNNPIELTAATGTLQLSDVTFTTIDVTEEEDPFDDFKQYTVIVEYSLSMASSLQAATTNELYVEVLDSDGAVLAKKDINQDNYFKQALFLSFDSKTKMPAISFKNTNPDITLNILSVSLFMGGYSNPKLLTDLNSGGNSILIGSTTYYDARSFNIEYQHNGNTLTKTGIELSYIDFVRNKENNFKAKKNGKTTFNVWYNDGQNMLYNVSSLRYYYNSKYSSVGLLNVLNYNGDKNFHTGELFIYDTLNFKRYVRNYSIAKNHDHSTKFTDKEIDDYGFVLSETNEKEITVEYAVNGGFVTRQKIRNENNCYNGVNDDNDLITDYTFASNRQESVKTYYKSNALGVKNTYDTMGNVLKTFDINNTATPVTTNTYGSTSSELLDKIVFDKSSTDEVTTLTYDNKKIATLTHSSNPIYNFLYDFRNNIKEIKIAGVSICTINYTYSTSEISKTITYATREKEKLTYNKYGKLIKLERATKDSAFNTVFDTTYYSYNKEDKIESEDSFLTETTASGNEYLETKLDGNGQPSTSWISPYNNYVLTITKSGSAVPSGLQKVINVTETDVSIDNKLYTKETTCVSSIDLSNAQQLYKTINLYDSNNSSTLFAEDLIEEKLGRGFKSSVIFSNIIYSKNYEFAPANNGTSSFVSKETLSFASTSGTVNKQLSYEYDNKGNIISVIGEGTVTYEYDHYNRLTRENNTNFNATYVYAYDIYGNITSKKKYAYAASETTPSSLQLTTTYAYGNANKTLLTKYNDSSITYDAINQPTSLLGNALIWNFGKLSSYGNTSFEYSMFGKRVKKTLGNQNTYYIYDNDRLIREDRSENNNVHTKITYIYGNKDVIGFRYESNGAYRDYYYRKNMFGDVIGLYYNNGGNVITAALYNYDAWGNCIITDVDGTGIGNINPIRYRGYYYDVETQLYWVSSRYYSPELCIWISPDSIEYLDPQSINGLNLYCYCFNNPVNYVDPDGHMPFLCALLILGAIGMVANVGSQALTDLAYGNEFKWENYLVAAGAGFLGGMCYAIPGVGSIVSAAVTSGLTTAGQMAVSGEDYDGWDYLIMAGGSAVLSGLTAWGFGKLSNNMAFFKDSNFILDNFTKFATNYGGITLKPTVILQAAGQIAIRETVAGFVGAPLSGIPGYFDRVYRLNKLGLSPADSFRYAF